MVDQKPSHRAAMVMAELLPVMRKRSDWSAATKQLRILVESHGEVPHRAAEAYGKVYQRCRGAMVFDVVVSRQRKYESVVLPRVNKWSTAVDEPSLATLAKTKIDARQYGLQRTEPLTLQAVAANLLSFCQTEGPSEDEGCRAWADPGSKALSTPRSWTQLSAVCRVSVQHCSPTCACDAAQMP